MKQLSILVDLDDTIENLTETLIQTLNDTYGTNVSLNDDLVWDMTKNFPTLSESQIYNALREPALWEKVTPLPGAVENINKLIRDGHRVMIVTSTHYKNLAVKLEPALFRFIPELTYRDVVMAHRKQMLLGDVMIDDNINNLIGGHYTGIMISAPHNRTVKSEDYGITRAENWDQIYEILCRIAQ